MATNTTDISPTNSTPTTDGPTTALYRVSTLEFTAILTLWLLYCCTGRWAPDQPLRILALMLSCAKLLIINLWFGARDLAMSLFITYLLGRLNLSTDRLGMCQGAVVVFWMVLDTAAMFFAPLKYANILCEAIMALGLLTYRIILVGALQPRGRRRWLIQLVCIILWGLGWGAMSGLYWAGLVDQLLVVMWLMTYAACFPRTELPSSLGTTPPLRSPWLSAIAQRRAERSP